MLDAQPTPEDAEALAARRARMMESLAAFVARHQAEASCRVAKRAEVEARWIDDLRQYHGRYDDATLASIKEAGGSQLYMNITAPKTNAMSARLMDLLFPTDDENWSVGPTPVPRLTEDAEAAAAAVEDLKAQAAGGEDVDPQQAAQAQAALPEVQAALEALQGQIAEARRRADLMSAEIADQLEECSYPAACRDMIEQACKMGTGVLEGPVSNDRIGRQWVAAEGGGFTLQQGGSPAPAFYWVDAWSFFPDPDARSAGDSESFYVRHLWKARHLREFAKTPGADQDAIRAVLREKPNTPAPDYLTRIRSLAGQSSDSTADLFQVWKFTGTLSAEDMRLLAEATGDADTAAEMQDMDDPLTDVRAVVWFCQSRVLKFAIYPLDSGEPLYSVFNLEKDEASIWGYGMPRILRAEQAAHNAAWRMVLDNAGQSVADDLLINKDAVTPADGSWSRSPRKVWFLKDNVATTTRAMEAFSTNAHVQELTTIIDLVRRQADEGSNMPVQAQGELGVTPQPTPVGTAVLRANSANVVFRRIVKNFDDDVTVPNIRRLYDWNMQFSPKEEIKGDYEVAARGSSVLLVREMQATNLMALALQFGGHPVYGKYQKDIEVLREVYRAHMLDHSEFVVSDSEAKQKEAQEREAMAAAQGGPAVDPEIESRKLDLQEDQLEAQVEMANMESATRLKVAEINRETAMMQLAEKMNMQEDQIAAMLTKAREDRRSKERSTAAEIAVRSSQQAPLNRTQIANG